MDKGVEIDIDGKRRPHFMAAQEKIK